MMRRTDRRDRILELHSQGYSNPEIGQILGCNRVTAWRATKDLPEPSPVVLDMPPTSAPVSPVGDAPDGKLLEIDDLALSVGVLRQRAAAGSTSAARDLAKLSITEIHRAGCADHVSRTVAETEMLGIFQIAKHYIVGPFLRRVCLEFPDVDEGRLSEMIEDTFDDIAREIESRSAAMEDGT